MNAHCASPENPMDHRDAQRGLSTQPARRGLIRKTTFGFVRSMARSSLEIADVNIIQREIRRSSKVIPSSRSLLIQRGFLPRPAHVCEGRLGF